MMTRWHAAALVLTCAAAFAPTPPPRAPRQTKVYFFDKLAESIKGATDLLSGKSRMTEANTKGALRDIRRALLDADVSKVVVDDLVERVTKNALGGEVTEGVDPSQQFVKIVYDELKRAMGGDDEALMSGGEGEQSVRAELEYREDGQPTVVLLCGLQGAGKTTAAAKLALRLQQEEGRKPLLVAADVYRPAAVEQLKLLGEQVGVPVYAEDFEPGEGNAVAIAERGLKEAQARDDVDVVVVDTAGRQVIEADLMRELRDVRQVTQPDETLLVLDAMTGQAAAGVAKQFDDAVPLTGAVLTKLDGDARGGAALSVRAVCGRPIKYVGVGERVQDLEPFFPARMASRILGMGDVVSLVEKAERLQSKDDAASQMERIVAGKATFDDFLEQTKMMASMGNLQNVAKMMPGMGGLDQSKLSEAEARIKVQESLIMSMTPAERSDPDLVIRSKSALSRQRRIARGAGRDADASRRFVSEFQQMRTMMQKMAAGQNPNAPPMPDEGPALNRAARRQAPPPAMQLRRALPQAPPAHRVPPGKPRAAQWRRRPLRRAPPQPCASAPPAPVRVRAAWRSAWPI